MWIPCEDIIVGNPIPVFEAKLVKPEFDNRVYRPDMVVDGWSNGRVVVRAASVRGYQHRYDGFPRQDDFTLGCSSDGSCLFIAVADGLSSAKHSHVGASYTTRYVVRWLNQTAAKLLKTTMAAKVDWSEVLGDCVRATSWFLAEETAKLFGKEVVPAQLTATTLVCGVIVTDENSSPQTYTVSIGDSGAWQLADGEFTQTSGGKVF